MNGEEGGKGAEKKIDEKENEGRDIEIKLKKMT